LAKYQRHHGKTTKLKDKASLIDLYTFGEVIALLIYMHYAKSSAVATNE